LKLPSTSLKNFSLLLFQSCVLLRHWVTEHERAFTTFMEYKIKVPVCGAIILNPDLTKVLLVRGWKSNATWGFPKGKINQQEKQTSCAIREVSIGLMKVFEEIGFDCSPYLRENEYLERKIHDQNVRLYMISGIDESEEFITQTRKEIGVFFVD
jgi:8-oxo-dGTP pyrophosphatase MutT (NUDIX family)